jgi:hypothetical protein
MELKLQCIKLPYQAPIRPSIPAAAFLSPVSKLPSIIYAMRDYPAPSPHHLKRRDPRIKDPRGF